MRRLFVGIIGLAGLALALAPAFAQDGKWGGVKGQVVWGGDKVPERAPLDLKENPDKAACLKDGKILDQTWIVNAKNKGLKNAFVWLQGPEGVQMPIHSSLQTIKDKRVVMDQPVCMFLPHALGLREGQTLVAKNSASIAHNFKWSGNPEINPGNNVLLPPGSEKEIDNLKADRFPVSIECNIHPWMKGWVRVYDHPYFAVTDENGNFEFKNAPAGDWQLMVWHGSGGWLGGRKGRDGQKISIPAGDTKDLGKLEYPPPEF